MFSHLPPSCANCQYNQVPIWCLFLPPTWSRRPFVSFPSTPSKVSERCPVQDVSAIDKPSAARASSRVFPQTDAVCGYHSEVSPIVIVLHLLTFRAAYGPCSHWILAQVGPRTVNELVRPPREVPVLVERGNCASCITCLLPSITLRILPAPRPPNSVRLSSPYKVARLRGLSS